MAGARDVRDRKVRGIGLRRLLDRLAGDGAVLRRDDKGIYSLYSESRDAPVVSAEAVRILADRDLVCATDDTKREFRLSEAGLALLRRYEAQHDPFRAQHQLMGARRVAPGGGRIPVNLAETPLGWLARRRGPDGRPLLDDDEFAAGERLRADFTYASLTPRLTQRWAEPSGAGPGRGRCDVEPRDAQIAAKQRFVRALDAVGPGLSDVLVAVCCHLQGLEEAEREFGWPVRSGKVVLKIALQRLSEHYRSGKGRRRAARPVPET